jgi:hypothetical protein
MKKILIRTGYDFDSKDTYVNLDKEYGGMSIEDKKLFINDLIEELEKESKFLATFWSAAQDIS